MRPRFPPESSARSSCISPAAAGPAAAASAGGSSISRRGESAHFSSLKGSLAFFERGWNEPPGER